jgi:DNA-binding beta-propeller fold protein YncE
MTSPRFARMTIPAATLLAAASALLAGGASASARIAPASALGSLHQLSGKNGCYTANGSSNGVSGACWKIRGGDSASTIVIAAGGRSAYLDAYGNDNSAHPARAVAVLSVFSRDPRTGVLRQLPGKAGCFSTDGDDQNGPNQCTKARDLGSGDATSIAISSNGRSLYVASQYETASKIAVGGVAIFSRNTATGTLRQLPGKLGCVSAKGDSSDGPHTCTVGREVDDISNVHITPDQKYLYASNYDGQPHSGIAVFRRNPVTGALAQLAGKDGCVTDDGTTGQSGSKAVCRAMPNLGNPWDVATPGNRFVYIPNRIDNLVQAFRRDAKGGLVPLKGNGACVSDSGSSPLGTDTCVQGRGLFDVERAVLSANTKFIYTSGFTNPSPIAVLNRNLRTGLLSERSGSSACISTTGETGDSILTCRPGRVLGGGYAGVLSPDGRTLYYTEDGSGSPSYTGLVIFRVSPATGAFSQLSGKDGCVTFNGASQAGTGTCERARAVQGLYQVAVSPDGRFVYVASSDDSGVAAFRAAT